MDKLSGIYTCDVMEVATRLGASRNFDIIEKKLRLDGREVTFFYVDGFIKDGVMQRIMQFLLSEKQSSNAKTLLARLPYVEVDLVTTFDGAVAAVLSGQCLLLSSDFKDGAILVDARTYPARTTAEPDTDRVMQGARDGFVETLVMNTALIRRRIRDTRLTMRHYSIGTESKTDVVVCYMDGVADEKLLSELDEKLKIFWNKKDGSD